MPALVDQVKDPNCHLPESARVIFKVLIATLMSLDKYIAVPDAEIGRWAKDDPVARRLTTIPGVGPLPATANVALAPPAVTFRSGRDCAACLGLTPLQKSTSRAASLCARPAVRGAPAASWLARMPARKLRMPVTVAFGHQNRPDRLDAVGQGRGLQSSGGGAGSSLAIVGSSSAVGRKVWRKGRQAEPGSQFTTTCLEHVVLIWTWFANFHTGPRRSPVASEAGHMAAPTYALFIPEDFLCACGSVLRRRHPRAARDQ